MENTSRSGCARLRGDTAKRYLDLANVILVGIDRDEKVAMINRKGCALLGRPEDEIVGQTWFRFVPEPEREAARKVFRELMAGHVAASEYAENHVLTRSGVALIAWRNSVVYDERGAPCGTLSSGEDITQKRRIEEALRASEARLRLITHQVPAILWSVDLDLRITLTVGTGLVGIDFQPGDLEGRQMGDVLAGYGSAALEPTLRALKGEASVMIGEFRGRWFETRVEPLRSDEGAIVGAVGLAIDITEERRSTETLMASEAELRALFASMSDVVLVLNDEGRYLKIPPTNPALLARPADEVVGRTVHEIFPRKQADAFLGHIRRALATRQSLEFEHQMPVGDREVCFSVVVSPMTDTTVLCVARDITERKRAEEERARLLAAAQRAKAEAEKANAAKDLFLATVSHEMRTPLSSILLRAEHLLRSAPDPATVPRAIAAMRRNACDLAQLIDDLLDISRIAANKIELKRERLELPPLVEAVVDTERAVAEEKGVGLEAAIDPEACLVEGDPRRLRQVVLNLLTNALKFTPRGGWVRVRLERRGDRAVLQVRDSGEGIAPSELPKLFSRFYQARRTAPRSKAGLGLGLALVRHFVELHGGTVRAESGGEGKGATFTVTLPLAGEPAGASPSPESPLPS